MALGFKGAQSDKINRLRAGAAAKRAEQVRDRGLTPRPTDDILPAKGTSIAAAPGPQPPGPSTLSGRARDTGYGRDYGPSATGRLKAPGDPTQAERYPKGLVSDIQDIERQRDVLSVADDYERQRQELLAQGVPEGEVEKILGAPPSPVTSEDPRQRTEDAFATEAVERPLYGAEDFVGAVETGTGQLSEQEFGDYKESLDTKFTSNGEKRLKYGADYTSETLQSLQQMTTDAILGQGSSVTEKVQVGDQRVGSVGSLLAKKAQQEGTTLSAEDAKDYVEQVGSLLSSATAVSLWMQNEAFNEYELEHKTEHAENQYTSDGVDVDAIDTAQKQNGFRIDDFESMLTNYFTSLDQGILGFTTSEVKEMIVPLVAELVGQKLIVPTSVNGNLRYNVNLSPSSGIIQYGEVLSGAIPGLAGSNLKAMRGVLPATYTHHGQGIQEKSGSTGTKAAKNKNVAGQSEQAMANQAGIKYTIEEKPAILVNTAMNTIGGNSNGSLGPDGLVGSGKWVELNAGDIESLVEEHRTQLNLDDDQIQFIKKAFTAGIGIMYAADEVAGKRFKFDKKSIISRFLSNAAEFAALQEEMEAVKAGGDITSLRKVREKIESYVKQFNSKVEQDFKKINRDNALTMADGSENIPQGTLAYMRENPDSFLGITFYQATANNRTGPSTRDTDFIGNKVTHRETTGFKHKPTSVYNIRDSAKKREAAIRDMAHNYFKDDYSKRKKSLQKLSTSDKSEISIRIMMAKQYLADGNKVSIPGKEGLVTFESAKMLSLYDYFRVYDAFTDPASGSNSILQHYAQKGKKLQEMFDNHMDPEGTLLNLDTLYKDADAKALYEELIGERGEMNSSVSLWNDANNIDTMMKLPSEQRTAIRYTAETQFDAIQSGPAIQSLLTGHRSYMSRTGMYGYADKGDLRSLYLSSKNIADALDKTFNTALKGDVKQSWSNVFRNFQERKGFFEDSGNYKKMEEFFAKIPIMQAYYGKDPMMMYDVASDALNQIPELQFMVSKGYGNDMNDHNATRMEIVKDFSSIITSNLQQVVDSDYSSVAKATARYFGALNASLAFNETPSGDTWFLGTDEWHGRYDEDAFQEVTKIVKDRNGKVIHQSVDRVPVANSALYSNKPKRVVSLDPDTGKETIVTTVAFPGKGITSAMPVTMIHSLDNYLVNLTTNLVNSRRREAAGNRNIPKANVKWIFDAAVVDTDSLLDVVETYNNEALVSLAKWNVFEGLLEHRNKEEAKAKKYVKHKGMANISVTPDRTGLVDAELDKRLAALQKDHSHVIHQGSVPLSNDKERSFAGITGWLDETYYYRPPKDPMVLTADGKKEPVYGPDKFYKDRQSWEQARKNYERLMKKIEDIKRDPSLYEESEVLSGIDSNIVKEDNNRTSRTYNVPVWLPPTLGNVEARKQMRLTPDQFNALLAVIKDHLRLDSKISRSMNKDYQSRSKGSLELAARQRRDDIPALVSSLSRNKDVAALSG